MLQSLTIENFAIIERVNIDFTEGMTVLSGETGAGKSIIIDALGILCGGRGSSEYIRQGDDKLLIPTHIYKIVTYPNTYASISYIIPNTNNLPCGNQCSPEKFMVPMQEVERVTGIEFYTKLAPYYAVQVKKDLNQIFKDAIKEK